MTKKCTRKHRQSTGRTRMVCMEGPSRRWSPTIITYKSRSGKTVIVCRQYRIVVWNTFCILRLVVLQIEKGQQGSVRRKKLAGCSGEFGKTTAKN